MTRRRLLGGFLFLTGVLACNSIAGINEPIDGNSPGGNTSGGTSSGSATSGGTSSGGSTKVNDYIGTWSTTGAGATQIVCAESQMVQITVTIEAGTTSDIVLSNDIAPGCFLEANINGTQANLVAGQTCQFDSEGFSFTYSYAPQSYFRLNDNKSASVSLQAVVRKDATGKECPFSEIGTYARQP